MNVDRAERSVLATPGSNSRMIAKALASDADVVMIDLEDAVAPDEKAAARSTVAEALCLSAPLSSPCHEKRRTSGRRLPLLSDQH